MFLNADRWKTDRYTYKKMYPNEIEIWTKSTYKNVHWGTINNDKYKV